MTGMATVLEVGQLHFEGNIIPGSWYEHLRRESGKTYAIAAILLSEIVYWHRPTEIRDEATGRVVERRKKFKADKLQRTYDSFANQFGFTKRQVKDALKFLQDKGLIDLEFRTITTKNGMKMGNVLFIDLHVAALREITYGQVRLNQRTPYDEKTVEGVRKNVIGVTEKRQTNTETTTETTTESSDGAVVSVDEEALNALLQIGVTPGPAQDLAGQHEKEQVLSWCEYAVACQATNPPGLVVAMLRGGETAPPRMDIPTGPSPGLSVAEETEPPNFAIAGSDVDGREAWQRVLEELQPQMNEATYETWLGGSHVVTVRDRELVIGVRDGYTVNWLQERWLTPIKHALAKVVEDGNWRVEFVDTGVRERET